MEMGTCLRLDRNSCLCLGNGGPEFYCGALHSWVALCSVKGSCFAAKRFNRATFVCEPSVCCECPWGFVLHPHEHPHSKSSQCVDTETSGMQRRQNEEAFIWMSEGEDIWDSENNPSQSTDGKQLKQSAFLRLDGCFYNFPPPITISVK